MARRRNEGLFEVLLDFPWWVSIIVGGVAFVMLRWVVPSMVAHNKILLAIAQGFSGVAGYIALLFLFPAGLSFFKQVIRGKKLEAQRDLESVRDLSWRDFEGLVGEAFRRQGYFLIEQGGNQPDGGIDLILRKDGQLIYVQCKHWKSRQVGVQIVREQFGILSASNATRVIVVTSGSFTEEARSFAAGKPMELVDGPALLQLIGEVQQSGQVVSSSVATTEVMACPKCGSEMRQRVAKQGANAGQSFWGCVRFPACRGTRAV